MLPVDDISEDVQCVIRLEVDLLHDGIKPPQVPMNI